MRIVVDDLTGTRIVAFLDEHLRQMHASTPVRHAYALEVSALRGPEVTFWSAWQGEDLLGCAALRRYPDRTGELKSMRTDPAHRRTGVASRLLTHVLAEARRMGCTRVNLETGTAAVFEPARRLYEKYGFQYCEPFGDYRPSPHNTFLTREL